MLELELELDLNLEEFLEYLEDFLPPGFLLFLLHFAMIDY